MRSSGVALSRLARMPAMPRRAETWEDRLLAGLVGVGGLIEIAAGAVPGDEPVAAACMLAMGVALLVRRTRPRVCLGIVLAALLIQTYLGVPASAQLMTIPAILIAAYSVGAHLDLPAGSLGLAMGALLAGGAITLDEPDVSDYGFGLLLITGPWVTGVLVRARGHAAAAAEEEARAVAASSQERARQAADAERARIARELHDIVSHGLSAMVVQATAAAELVDRDPTAARAAMHEVQATGREAMVEMSHLLGLLRGPDAPGRGPQPTLGDLQQLVQAEQSAGREVSLEFEGSGTQLPRGLALSVYRIVQESLTNVRKHAGHARCRVRVRFTPGGLEVEVVDDGTSLGGTDPGHGFGLAGIRERAELYGGTVEAGPRADATGWRVRARFPFDDKAVSA